MAARWGHPLHEVATTRSLHRAADGFGRPWWCARHDFAALCSDSIAAMRGGRTARHGSPDEIMRGGLHDIFETGIPVH